MSEQYSDLKIEGFYDFCYRLRNVRIFDFSLDFKGCYHHFHMDYFLNREFKGKYNFSTH